MAKIIKSQDGGDIILEGNVGIGESDPSEKLHIKDLLFGGVKETIILENNNGSTNEGNAIRWIAGGATNGVTLVGLRDGSQGGRFEFKTSTTYNAAPSTKMVIKDGGEVGIGTSNPPHVLSIDSDLSTIPSFQFDNTAAAPGFAIGEAISGSTYRSFAIQAVNGNWEFGTNSSSTDSNLFANTFTPRMTITDGGNVGIGTSSPNINTKLHVEGRGYFSTSMYISAVTGNNEFATSPNGSGSTTMYIGNAAIQVSSDYRLKENIRDSQLNALNSINSLRLVDFTWNEATDLGGFIKNCRGTFTGFLAQEAIQYIPSMISAPRDENGNIDTESKNTWHVDVGAALGITFKAIQELSAKVDQLEEQVNG